MVRENHVGKSRDKSGLKKSVEAEMSSKEHEKPLEENLQKIKVADESDKSVCEAKKPKKVDETVTEDSKEEKSSGNLDLDITPPLISPNTFDESYDSDDDITKPPNPPKSGLLRSNAEPYPSGGSLIRSNAEPYPSGGSLIRSNTEPYPSGGSLIRSNAEPYPSAGSLIRANTNISLSGSLIFSMLHFQLT